MNNNQPQERNTTYRLVPEGEPIENGEAFLCTYIQDIKNYKVVRADEVHMRFKELPSIDTVDESDPLFGGLERIAYNLDKGERPASARMIRLEIQKLKSLTEETKPVVSAVEILSKYKPIALAGTMKCYSELDVLQIISQFKGNPSIQQISDAWDAAETRLLYEQNKEKWTDCSEPHTKETYLKNQ